MYEEFQNAVGFIRASSNTLRNTTPRGAWYTINHKIRRSNISGWHVKNDETNFVINGLFTYLFRCHSELIMRNVEL